jgi:hypothetical protein
MGAHFSPDWRMFLPDRGVCVVAPPAQDRAHLRLRQNPDGSREIWLNTGLKTEREIFIGKETES